MGFKQKAVSATTLSAVVKTNLQICLDFESCTEKLVQFSNAMDDIIEIYDSDSNDCTVTSKY